MTQPCRIKVDSLNGDKLACNTEYVSIVLSFRHELVGATQVPSQPFILVGRDGPDVKAVA